MPLPYSRFSVPAAVAVSLLTGSACNWNFCGTAAWLELLKTEATKSCGWESNPLREVAVPRAGRFSVQFTFTVVVPVCVRIES